jgi:two-component system C4-dicarboxylate transport response regulator DctD
MARLREELLLAANAPSHVLLLGETGTGKGVAARALHALSRRRDAPFETVDCTALSPTLVESELFGHERGAFTGAYERRRGRLERAADGTLFLDEIGELELGLQAKLLRALEERRFDRIGGRAPLGLAARVVAATHRDLEADVAAGRFRRDLFYRLDVLRVRVPPLRERRVDLPVLVDHLLQRAARRLEREPIRATRTLLDRLHALEWPGNVRELANRLESMTVRADGAELESRDLSWDASPRAPRAKNEQHELAELLRECGGNVARVARRLGRPRSTVRYRIARHGLSHLIPRD